MVIMLRSASRPTFAVLGWLQVLSMQKQSQLILRSAHRWPDTCPPWL